MNVGTPLTSTARLFVSLLVAFSYPLQSHPSRKSLMSLMNHYIDNDAEISDNVYNFRYMLITVSAFFSCCGSHLTSAVF